MGWLDLPGTIGLVAEYFLKTTAVLTLALLAAAAARRRPAAFRHFVLSFALVGLLLLPVLSLAPVGWRTSLLPPHPARPAETGARGLLPAQPYSTGGRTRASDADVRSLPSEAVRVPETASAAGGAAELPAEHSSEPAASRPIPVASSSFPLSQAAGRSPFRDRILSSSAVNIGLSVLWSAGLFVLWPCGLRAALREPSS